MKKAVLCFTGDNGNSLVLTPLLLGDDATIDLSVHVGAKTRGFVGETDCWILREAWSNFAQAMKRLRDSRQGEATIESMSPRELHLTVQSTDRAGHMAVGGLVGTNLNGRVATLEFTPFAFDPSSLPELARIAASWLA